MKVIKNCSCWEEILKKKFDYCKEDVEEAQAILSILDGKVRCYDNLEEKYKKGEESVEVRN